MRKLIFFTLLTTLSLPASAQLARPSAEQELIATISSFFDAMRARDTTGLRALFYPEATMFTIATDSTGKAVHIRGDVERYLKAVGTPNENTLDERIYSYQVRVDGALGSVLTDYAFYLGENFSHCGLNNFTLIETEAGWKITSVTDTRRREGCTESPEGKINRLLDNWHRAAATADEDTFFGSMTPQAVYIGTDASERWLRDQLREWSKEYFERESAWSFRPTSRQLRLSDDQTLAWFDEKLDTWMGTCIGSGVVRRTESGWKIEHYHLAFTVPNDKMDSVLKLLKED